MNKLWYIYRSQKTPTRIEYTIKYYHLGRLLSNKKELQVYTAWTNLKSIMLSERSQRAKAQSRGWKTDYTEQEETLGDDGDSLCLDCVDGYVTISLSKLKELHNWNW